MMKTESTRGPLEEVNATMLAVERYGEPRFREQRSRGQQMMKPEPENHELNSENKRLNNRTTRRGDNQPSAEQNHGED